MSEDYEVESIQLIQGWAYSDMTPKKSKGKSKKRMPLGFRPAKKGSHVSKKSIVRKKVK